MPEKEFTRMLDPDVCVFKAQVSGSSGLMHSANTLVAGFAAVGEQQVGVMPDRAAVEAALTVGPNSIDNRYIRLGHYCQD